MVECSAIDGATIVAGKETKALWGKQKFKCQVLSGRYVSVST